MGTSNNKGIIKSVKKVKFGSYAKGTTFSKGDYIPVAADVLTVVR